MAFLTTNPSPFLINVPELQNVVTSATGGSGLASLSNTINDILTLVNTANSQLNINTIGSSTSGSVTFTSNINLSNSQLTFLGSNLLGSNTLNGPAGFLAFQVGSVEQARLTTSGLGIGTTSPTVKLDVIGSASISNNLNVGNTINANSAAVAGAINAHTVYISSALGVAVSTPELTLDISGGAIIRGPLYVSSFGLVTSQIGNIIASGDIFANGVFYPSDPALKTNIRDYISPGLPTPVRFDWRASGEPDIGVLADEVRTLEPACVIRSPRGGLTVDYAKLSVLLLAEVRVLKAQMSTVMARLP
jgi:hypothetical protein